MTEKYAPPAKTSEKKFCFQYSNKLTYMNKLRDRANRAGNLKKSRCISFLRKLGGAPG